MKVYLVVYDWKDDGCGSGSTEHTVFTTLEAAKKQLKLIRDDDIKDGLGALAVQNPDCYSIVCDVFDEYFCFEKGNEYNNYTNAWIEDLELQN